MPEMITWVIDNKRQSGAFFEFSVKARGFLAMIKQKYVYWKDDDAWLGYLEEFPDYWTQGTSEDDLKEHLVDLYKELTSGSIPNVRRVAELDVA